MILPALEQIQAEIVAAVPGCQTQIIPNGSPSAQHSLLIDHSHALAVASYLRDDSQLRLDFCSNVTGVDWLPHETSEKVKVKKVVEGVEQEVEEVRKTTTPGYLEVVYHLYSMERKHWPGHPAHAHRGPRRESASAVDDPGVARGGVPGTRDLRPLRRHLRRPS